MTALQHILCLVLRSINQLHFSSLLLGVSKELCLVFACKKRRLAHRRPAGDHRFLSQALVQAQLG